MKNRDTPALGYNGSDKSNFLTMGVFGGCERKSWFKKSRGANRTLAVLGIVHFKGEYLVHLG